MAEQMEQMTVDYRSMGFLSERFQQIENQLMSICGRDLDDGDGNIRHQDGTIDRIEEQVRRAYTAQLEAAGQEVPDPLAVSLPGLRELNTAVEISLARIQALREQLDGLTFTVPVRVVTQEESS